MKADPTAACLLCGSTSNRTGMTRHLNSCVPAFDSAGGHAVPLIRLRVDAGPDLPYWMDLEVRAPARLALLDIFLRKTWLGCCRHDSRFLTGKREAYSARPGRATDVLREGNLQTSMGEALQWQRGWFTFEFDSGNLTTLRLRITHRRTGRVGRSAVRLLARNRPAAWPCRECGRTATMICPADRTLLCPDHARAHSCGGRALLPVVDSPRMGVCCYQGP